MDGEIFPWPFLIQEAFQLDSEVVFALGILSRRQKSLIARQPNVQGRSCTASYIIQSLDLVAQTYIILDLQSLHRSVIVSCKRPSLAIVHGKSSLLVDKRGLEWTRADTCIYSSSRFDLGRGTSLR